MELQFKVNQNIPTVFEYLSDMDKFASIHPIISKIIKTGNNEYKVYETLKFGIIPLPFVYPVEIKADKINNTITMNATVFKLTKIELKFFLSEFEDKALVKELITFNTPLPIKPILKNIFIKQHNLLFENMNNLKL